MPAISTDRGRHAALSNLVAWQEQGRYELPAGVLAAVDVHRAAQALTVPEPPPLRHIEDVAAHAVDLLAAGQSVDPVKMAADTEAARDLAARLDAARSLVGLAVESAAQRAVAAATDACHRIVVEHLQPAYAEVLAQAREVAPALRGQDLTDGGWTATAKAREARRTLTALADRHRLLREAHTICLGLSGQAPERDTQEQFALLREPQALVPGYSANRPLPRADIPADPAAALLWLATEGEPAGPWLPTTNQQDGAWLAVFGEAEQQRRVASVSARAHAGQRV